MSKVMKLLQMKVWNGGDNTLWKQIVEQATTNEDQI